MRKSLMLIPVVLSVTALSFLACSPSQPPNTQTPVPPPTTSTEPSTTETTTTPVTETPVSTQPQGELAVHFIDVGRGDAILIDLNDIEVLIADWRREYNQVRPHSSLGYRPPAPEAKIPVTLTQ